MSETTRTALMSYLDQLLGVNDVNEDPSNNGLQVEGAENVRKALFGVDACAELFQVAAEENADFIFVHHGISWGTGMKYLTGIVASRLQVLFKHNMSLYASHLPLDRHSSLGHNALIAQGLQMTGLTPFFQHGDVQIGCYGTLPRELPLQELAENINSNLHTDCAVLTGEKDVVKHIGIVSGGGADAIEDCRNIGLDCLITGEVEHKHVSLSREAGVSVIAAGHYRTEVPGVEEVRKTVEEQFDIPCVWYGVPSGL